MNVEQLSSRAGTHGDSANIEDRLAVLEESLRDMRKKDSVSILCFSDSWDRLFAAFMLANGALAMGQEVHMFFTFWALCALRSKTRSKRSKSLVDRLLAGMLPAEAESASLSKFNCAGLGKLMIRKRMKARNIDQLDDLIQNACEMGVQIHVCEMAADLLGFEAEDLMRAGPAQMCGVASFLGHVLKGQTAFFI